MGTRLLFKRGLFGVALALLPAACGLLAACSSPSATPVPSATQLTLAPTASITLTPSITPTATPLPPALPVVASPALAHIDFQDASRGWGIAVNDKGYIVRTVDGGRTWLNATPAGLDSLGSSAHLFVLDSQRVWALVPGRDFYSASLYRTTDGGLTWAFNPLPFGGADIQFLDGSTGRALADRGAGAGSNAVGLYQTTDGGVTWTYVFHNDPAEPGASNSLPLEGIKNGLTFLNPDDGWVSGSLPVPGNIYLYASRDGGVSWSQQAIQPLSGDKDRLTMAHSPLFFGQVGIFPLTFYETDATLLIFYVSQDGGASWSMSPQAIPAGRYSFADSTRGYSWDGGNTILITNDSGRTWQTISTNLDLSSKLNQIDFVPASKGSYTGWALTSLDENNHSQLYMTKDNGATWLPLIP